VNEISVRNAIRNMLKQYLYDVDVVTDGIVCGKCQTVIVPRSGRPDLKATFDSHLHPGVNRPTLRIEVKVVKSSKTAFNLKLITVVQREGLSKRTGSGHLVYLALGIIAAGVHKDRLARIYCVPWTEWLKIESKVTPYQNSIPLLAGKGMRKEIQDEKLDVKHLLQGWELRKLTRGWGIPSTHQLYTDIGGGV
jgi:hypothetical protein